jgi:hypothetical protein
MLAETQSTRRRKDSRQNSDFPFFLRVLCVSASYSSEGSLFPTVLRFPVGEHAAQ